MGKVALVVVAVVVGWNAFAVGGDVRWIDGTELPVEGRAFAETVGGPYGRLPRRYAEKVSAIDRRCGADSCGVTIRFRTDSSTLRFRWTLANSGSFAEDRYMTQMAMGGIDVYEESEEGCRLCLTGASRGGPNMSGTNAVSEVSVPWVSGRTAVVYLPIRGIVSSFSVGVDAGAKVEPSPRSHADVKPVVVYGTSLVHGGCVSRPGLVFTSQISRLLDIPVVNLGFASSGRMEPVIVDILGEAEASAYVLECLDNLTLEELKERFEPFVRRLHGKRPDVPILVSENLDVRQDAWRSHARGVCRRLKAEDSAKWANLHYLERGELMPDDWDLTLDRCHPNDAGARYMGRAYAKAIGGMLGLAKECQSVVRQGKD